MKKYFRFSTEAGKRHNDPQKNDPTKQDESDNDPTRIRTDRSAKEHPETPSPEEGKGGAHEPGREPYKRESPTKPLQENERNPTGTSSGNESDSPDFVPKRNFNQAQQEKSDVDSLERDDEGNPVLEEALQVA